MVVVHMVGQVDVRHEALAARGALEWFLQRGHFCCRIIIVQRCPIQEFLVFWIDNDCQFGGLLAVNWLILLVLLLEWHVAGFQMVEQMVEHVVRRAAFHAHKQAW